MHKSMRLTTLLISLTLFFLQSAYALDEKKPEKKSEKNTEESIAQKETIIKSDTLNIQTETREFVYEGNVHVTQDDLTLTAERLEGTYSENNEITALEALRNVEIVKGEGIKAKSNKASYDAKTEVITLTENPEVQQKGSVLNADIVKIFLKEDRSEAIGEVQVKILKDDAKDSDLSELKKEKEAS